MDIVHERSVGMDISKRDAKVCIRVPGKRLGQFTSTVTTWGSTTNQILELRRFLEEQHVTVVVMEATSDSIISLGGRPRCSSRPSAVSDVPTLITDPA
ncbi:hypothetical protein ACVWY0_004202 [Arthrobacter sp. UYNi723]